MNLDRVPLTLLLILGLGASACTGGGEWAEVCLDIAPPKGTEGSMTPCLEPPMGPCLSAIPGEPGLAMPGGEVPRASTR